MEFLASFKYLVSAITSRPTKLRKTDKPKIQAELNYISTVKTIVQRSREFFESNWPIVERSYTELYTEYFADNPNYFKSFGTFLSLKPFYIKSATPKDIEMCCCKVHLHARWSVKALIECCKKQNIPVDFNDYKSFFAYLTKNCKIVETTCIH